MLLRVALGVANTNDMNTAATVASATARPIAPKVHIFEQAGLGLAPFRYRGMTKETYQACPEAPLQPGGSCDFCGTGIFFHYHFESADGKQFKVGSDCVLKSGDKGMKKIVSDEERKKRHAAADRKHDRDLRRLYAAWSRRDEVAPTLAAQPHPLRFVSRDGATAGNPLTLLDWCDWTMANAGMSGRLKVAAIIEKIAVSS